MQFIPRIFEENQIMTVKTAASIIFSLMEQLLYDINDAEVAMMEASSKQVDDALVSTRVFHLIVDHH